GGRLQPGRQPDRPRPPQRRRRGDAQGGARRSPRPLPPVPDAALAACGLAKPFMSSTDAAPTDLRRLVIVPAFNEADSIAGVIADLRRNVPDYDVVVIDDGSTDGTADIARRAAAEAGAAGRVRVLSLPFN